MNWWMLKGFHKSMGGTAMSTRWGNVIFKTWKSVRAGCFHLAVMGREGIRGETSFADAVQLQCLREGKVFASAGRWISKRSATSLSVKPFLKLEHWGIESSPDLSAMSMCLSCRYISDAGDSYRCWWPHLWQQCPAGVQHIARTAVFLCGAPDRWARVYRHLQHNQRQPQTLIYCHTKTPKHKKAQWTNAANVTQQAYTWAVYTQVDQKDRAFI